MYGLQTYELTIIMFESDDFDQVLSQLDFPEVEGPVKRNLVKETEHSVLSSVSNHKDTQQLIENFQLSHKQPSSIENNCTLLTNVGNNKNTQNSSLMRTNLLSPKHSKRKIINSHFDRQKKRKFPGPAGILTGALEESRDDNICQIELLSQDVDFTQHNLQRDIFESPIWKRLLDDCKDWQLNNIDSIKSIKLQALAGNLRRQKAQTVTAFVEAVDRSVTDPLIILRDDTGSIKCTLHRDAWTGFSSYIVSDYCALILQRPTVLTTGGAFKKHYLNITLRNILGIYSSVVLKEDKVVPEAYSIMYEEDFTVIKSEKSDDNLDTPLEQSNGAEDLFDGLENIFSDDLF